MEIKGFSRSKLSWLSVRREAFIAGKRRWVARMNEKDRSERLKAALRENLKRRKAQARGREADKNDRDGRAGPDSPDHARRGAGKGPAPNRNPAPADEE